MNLTKNQIFNLIGNAKLTNEVLLKLASNERRLRHEGSKVIKDKVPTDEAYALTYSAYMIGENYSRFSKAYTKELEDKLSQRTKRMLVDAIADFDYPNSIENKQGDELVEIILTSTFTPLGTELILNIVDTIIDQAFKEFMIKPLPPIE